MNMTVLHHNVQVLELPDAAVRERVLRIARVRRALIMALDETHWLVHAREVRQVMQACQRAGVVVKVQTYGE